MQITIVAALLPVLALVSQVSASAPRCTFEYKEHFGLQPPSGCPQDGDWTDCCLVPMSAYDAAHPIVGKYTGVCAVDPMIVQGEPDICRRLVDRHH